MVQHRAFVEEVGTIGDSKGLADVVVGDKDADIAFPEVRHDILYILHGNRVDAGKRLVKQQEHGVVGKRTRNLRAAAFATAELYAFAFAYVLQAEFIKQRFQLLALLLFGEVLTELEDGPYVVFDRHLAEDRGFLRQVADTHLRAPVHREARNLKTPWLATFRPLGVLVLKNGALLVSITGALEVHLATVGLDDAHNHVERGGLACSVGAKQTYYLTLTDAHRHLFHYGARAVYLYYFVGIQSHIIPSLNISWICIIPR